MRAEPLRGVGRRGEGEGADGLGSCLFFGGGFRVQGFGFMVYGLWFMVYGLWFMVYGLWFMVYGLWFMVEASGVGCTSNTAYRGTLPRRRAPPRATTGRMRRFRGWLVFEAHRLLFHSTLGLRVITKKKVED